MNVFSSLHRRTGWAAEAPLPVAIGRNPAFWAGLVTILVFALALRVGFALKVPTIQRPDEIFQTMEPAHRLVYGWGVITWEWREGLRSWLLPGALAALMVATRAMSGNADAYLTVIPVTLAVGSLAIVAAGYILGWRHYGFPGALLTGLACAIWPDLVFFAPKTLNEVQAVPFLTFAAFLAGIMPQPGPDHRPAPRIALAIGLCLGITFCLRLQLAPAIAVIGVWALVKSRRSALVLLLVGSSVPVLLCGLLDLVTLGSFLQSFWKNYVINVVQGKADLYGTAPLTGYVTSLAVRWGAAAIPLAILFVLGARSAPVLALTAVAIFVSHSLISHKEPSFIYAAIPSAIIVAGLGSAEAIRLLPSLLRPAIRPATLVASAALLWLLVAGLTDSVMLARQLRGDDTDMLRAYALIRSKPDLCGLALYHSGIRPQDSGGYTNLNRPVPMSVIGNGVSDVTEANYLLYKLDQTGAPPPWDSVACFHRICVAHHDQACTPNPDTAINTVLNRIGE